jgi:hypothetical protein
MEVDSKMGNWPYGKTLSYCHPAGKTPLKRTANGLQTDIVEKLAAGQKERGEFDER